MTVIASLWMIMAVTGFGFFSGGTTSLALSLVLLYGTGAALIVVICAVYRLVNRSAVKRTETAPEDNAAGAFVDTARSATEELLAALRPQAATGRPQAATGRPQDAPASVRTVRPAAAAESAAKGAAAVASAVAASKQPAKQQGGQTVKQSGTQPVLQPVTASVKQGGTPKPSSAKTAPSKGAVTPAPKPSAKSALNKSVPKKSVPKKAAAQPKAAKASQAKGRPANNSGSKSTPAKRTGGSAERMPAKKQSSTAKDSGPGPVAGPAVSAQQSTCSSPAKSARPVLVLASSNVSVQPSRLHIPDSRKRAS